MMKHESYGELSLPVKLGHDLKYHDNVFRKIDASF